MLEAANAVAKGFEMEVEKMNRNFDAQLQELVREEEEAKEKIRIKAEREEKKRKEREEKLEKDKLRRLRGQPFKFSTSKR